jgi:hypothetical protein
MGALILELESLYTSKGDSWMLRPCLDCFGLAPDSCRESYLLPAATSCCIFIILALAHQIQESVVLVFIGGLRGAPLVRERAAVGSWLSDF